MALILAVRNGESVFIGDTKVTLIDVFHAQHFKVRVDGPLDYVFDIRASERVEILPDVFLSAGNTGTTDEVKFVLEAPRDKVILRERLYRKTRTG
jgi:sRNA-binding carbon storage regulator CsrA